MTPADRVIADAVAAVISARITTALDQHLPATDPATAILIATEAAQRAVHELRRDGWHITALPVPLTAHHPTET